MSVTYRLKIINNNRILPITDANSTVLFEVDKYTFENFKDKDDLFSKYNIRNIKTSRNDVVITYQNNGRDHYIKDIVFSDDDLLFDIRKLYNKLNLYASPADETNINFIGLVARTFINFKGYEGICGNILNKLSIDCSSEYFAFLRGIFKDPSKNYREIRELYFLSKWFENTKKMNNNSNINEEDENKQINMFEYMRETTKGISK